MSCPSDEEFERFFRGNLGEVEGLRTFQHMNRCPACRDRYGSLSAILRERMLEESAASGRLPRDRERLEARILSAVEKDRATRKRVEGRPTRPYLWRVPLAVAAAVLLAVILVRHLGESRWKGRPGDIQGAQLLVAREGKGLRTLRAENSEVGPGDLLLTLPDSGATVELPDGALLRMSSGTLVGFGAREDEPFVYLARGAARVTSPGGGSLPVNVAGRVLAVSGSAEFLVEETSPGAARRWAEMMVAGHRYASIFPPVFADAGPYRPSFWLHTTEGRTEGAAGVVVPAGLAAVVDKVPLLPYRIGSDSQLFPPANEFLSPTEMAVVRDLLDETEGMTERILAVARDRKREEEVRGLAIWLLGEIGDEAALPGLRTLLEDLTAPPVLRSASVAVLARVSTSDVPWNYARDPEPAVAEAAMLACSRARPAEAADRLEGLLADPDRPPAQRAMAAWLLQRRRRPIAVPILEDLLSSGDLDAASRAADLLARHPDREAARAALIRAFEAGSNGLRTRLLVSLGDQKIPGAEAWAREVLGRPDSLSDPRSAAAFRSALRYLSLLHAPDLSEPILCALERGPGATRLLALQVLGLQPPVDGPTLRQVQRILCDPASSELERALALNAVRSESGILAGFVNDPSPEISGTARRLLIEGDRGFHRRELCVSTLDHPLLAARKAAWARLGEGDPGEAIRRARAADLTRIDVEAVLRGLEVALVTPRPAAALAPAGDALERILETSKRPDLRWRAMGLLTRLGRKGVEKARSATEALLGDPGEDVRLRATAAGEVATWAESPREFELLATVLREGPPFLAERVASALAFRDPPPPARAVEELRRASTSERVETLLAVLPPIDGSRLRRALSSPALDSRVLALCRLSLADLGIPGLDRLESDGAPEVRLAAMAARLRRGEQVPASRLEKALNATLARADDPRLSKTLRSLAARIAEPGGREVATRILRALEILARSIVKTDLERHLLLRKLRFSALRAEQLSRLRGGGSGAARIRAVADLGYSGSRADVLLLLAAAGDARESEELQRTALDSAAALLGRYAGGAEPGPALERLAGWWAERRYALRVPVLPR